MELFCFLPERITEEYLDRSDRIILSKVRVMNFMPFYIINDKEILYKQIHYLLQEAYFGIVNGIFIYSVEQMIR